MTFERCMYLTCHMLFGRLTHDKSFFGIRMQRYVMVDSFWLFAPVFLTLVVCDMWVYTPVRILHPDFSVDLKYCV